MWRSHLCDNIMILNMITETRNKGNTEKNKNLKSKPIKSSKIIVKPLSVIP